MMKLIAFPFAAFGGAILALICLAAWMVILPVGAAYAVLTLYRRSLRRSAQTRAPGDARIVFGVSY